MDVDVNKSAQAVKKADIICKIYENDEIKVLADLVEGRWILMWCDMKLQEAADRLVQKGLVRIMNEDTEGPAGRYELWPIIRQRIAITGATTVLCEGGYGLLG